MMKNDWYEAGDQVKKLVQDAIDSKDFSELSDTISNVLNDTVNGIQSVIRDSFRTQEGAQKGSRQYTDSQEYREAATNSRAAEQIRREMKERKKVPVPVKFQAPGAFSGNAMKWVGYSLSAVFGFAAFILLMVGFSGVIPVLIPAGILGVFFGGSLCLGIKGSQRCGLAKRFRRYRAVLGKRTYCPVEELASSVGQTDRFVRRDLKRMIRLGYFVEGHLDRREAILMTDQETYQQYLSAQTEYEKREARKQEIHEKDETKQTLTPECRELIEEGKQYIEHIHRCNDRILNECISAKLDRLELVTTRIFTEAEKDPDVVPELKKMMSYYLPTTKKLLDAYCELDEQPISGQNIEHTKKEIEAALDTLNRAFENLLDSLFEETAWDISSDISVLHTMLAQEGLTGTDFEQKAQ